MMLKLHLLGGVFLLAMLGSCQAKSTPQQSTASDTTPAPETAEQTVAPTCPTPSTPLNGNVVYRSDNTRLPGSEVIFECSDGYVLDGDGTWECSAGGTWPNVTAPSCEKIECGALPKPEQGKVSYKYATNVTATLICDKDFTLEGSEVRTCVNKKWTGEKTTCSSGGSSNLVVIIIVVILGVIAVGALVAVAVFFFMKRRTARSREVTRPAGGAYQAVETKTGGDGGDVEMGSKPDTGDEEKDK